MPQQSKKTRIAAARREYIKLTRDYHVAGRRAAGKPERSAVKKDYHLIQHERARVGRQLGRLTGVHKGR